MRRNLVQRDWQCFCKHTHREGNIAADWLASEALKQPPCYQQLLTCLPGLGPLYFYDISACFDFVINYEEKDFIRDKMIKFPPGHKIPKEEERKGKPYCLWYDKWTHSTQNCVIFRIILKRLLGQRFVPDSRSTNGNRDITVCRSSRDQYDVC